MRRFPCFCFIALITAGAHAQTPITFSTPSPLSNGEVGIGYEDLIRFTGGTPPPGSFNPVYTFTSTFAVPGLVLVRGSGDYVQLGGTPTTAGNYTFNLTVSDGRGGQATKAYALRIFPRLEIVTTSPLPDGEEGVPYSQTLEWRGGVEPYRTFQCISNHFEFTCNQGLFSGRISSVSGRTQTLLCAARLNIVSGIGNMQSRCFDLTVRPGLAITDTQFGTGPAGVAYSHQLTAVRGRAPYTWSATGTLPAGLTFSSSGRLSGTPTQAGTFPITVRVTDANGTLVGKNLSLTITGAPFTITTSSLPAATAGQSYSHQLTSANGQGAVTWAISGLPAGVTHSPSGVISGTPAQPGTYTIFLNATDSTGRTATRTLTFSVAATEPAPIQLPNPGGNLTAGTVGRLYAQLVSPTGGTPPYTVTITGLPPGLSTSSLGDITGRPTAAGTYTVNVSVRDAAGQTASTQYSLFIAPGDSPLTITSTALPSGTVGQSYSQQLASANGQGDVTWVATGLPAGVTASPAGVLSGIPTQAGNYTVVVTATDSTGRTATATLTLNVAAAGAPFGITTTSLGAGTAGQSYSQQLTTANGQGEVKWSAAALPTWATLSPAGVVSGTPPQAGVYTIAVIATDSTGKTATATLTLNVAAAAPPFSITTTSLPAGTAGQRYSQQLTSSNGQGEVKWSAPALPGWLTLTAGGLLSGTPPQVGSFTVAVTATDSTGRTTTSTLTINVLAAQSSISCEFVPSGTPTVRAEGLNELLGDIVLRCTGAAQTSSEQQEPFLANFQVFLNTNITSRMISAQGRNDLTEALLLIDEPPPGKELLANHPDTGLKQGNAYLGSRVGNNRLLWTGIPLLPPGSAGVRMFRITNVRANASQLNVPPGQQMGIQPIVSITSTTSPNSPIPITNSQPTVGFIQPGLIFNLRETANYERDPVLPQCTNSPAALKNFTAEFREGFPNAFKIRHANVTPSNPDAPIQQGCCRVFPFGSESGYYVPNPESIGLADSGTRLAARFNNIPAGGTLYVSINEAPGSTASARLMGASTSTPSVVNGTPVAEVAIVNGTGFAVWEISSSNPSALDVVYFYLASSFQPGTAVGTSSVTGAFEAPELSAGLDRAGRPIDKVPAFSAGDLIGDPARGAPAAFTVRPCGTSGLIPQPAVTSGALPVNYRQQGNVPTGLSFYLFSRGDPITDVKAGSPNVTWFTVDQNTTTTPVTFKINLNPAGLAPGSYTGSFPVSGNGIGTSNFTIPLNVLPPGPHFTRWGVTNAASYVPNVISPGGIQTIFGDRLGPRDPVTAQLTPEGKLSTKIGDTRVLVNGVESPMVYSSSGQVSFITPLLLSTGDTLYVLEVEHQGVKSPQVVVPVARAVPALLTANGSGFGPAAALNQDNSFNSVTGELPGRYVSFFGVGGPATDPPGRDGEINTALGRFTEPVKVLFNGQEVPAADVAYAGPAPSLVYGAWQSVVRIPANAKRNQPNYIQFVFGDVSTQPGVEVLVQ